MPDNYQKNQIDRVKEITARLEEGVKQIFTSDRYKAWMNTMSKFHNYSLNNTILIAMQRPDATLVAGYNAWKQMGRQVKKGEKAIRILAPAPYKRKVEVEKLDPFTQEPVIGPDGTPVKETREIQQAAFKVVNVFDVSSTEGKELPSLGPEELSGDVDHYDTLFEALRQTCPVPISFEDIPGGAKGYYSLAEDRIAICSGMSQVQTIKTLIHEMAHKKMHCPHLPGQEQRIPSSKQEPHGREDAAIPAPGPQETLGQQGLSGLENSAGQDHPGEQEETNEAKEREAEQERLTRDTKEVQAESVAYTICQHYGIDTSDYSFGYIAAWSGSVELLQLKESLDVIRKAASEMITEIDGQVKSLMQEKPAIAKDTASQESAEKETDWTDGYEKSDSSSDVRRMDTERPDAARGDAGRKKESSEEKEHPESSRRSVLGTLKIKQQESAEIRGADRPLRIHQEERAS